MASTSMNDIKSRIKSVSSTMQITKAMELVATSKLRRAKERLERSRPFCDVLGCAIADIQSSKELGESEWTRERAGNRTLYVVIAGDRGLAGGYNASIFKLAGELAKDGDSAYLPIGKKAHEFYSHKGKKIYSDAFLYVDDVSVGDSLAIGECVCGGFVAGEFDSVVLVYTKFGSMLVQTPVYEKLLPMKRESGESTASEGGFAPLYDSDPVEMLDKIVPQYVGGVIYSAVCESVASELGARRTAMESANKNAGEIIDTLRLEFNRARQAVITQEITEIVSGSEAL